jgi:hypothetical protein
MSTKHSRESRVVAGLRKRLLLAEAIFSDEFILRETEGTFSRAMVGLHVSLQDVRLEVLRALPKWTRRVL